MERPAFETSRNEHFDTSKTTTTSDESKKKGSLLRRTQNLLEKRSHLNPLTSATKTIMNKIQINSSNADKNKTGIDYYSKGGRTSSNLKSHPRTIQSQSTNYNMSSPDGPVSLTHGTAVRSDLFDDKMGIKRVVINEENQQQRSTSQTFTSRPKNPESPSVTHQLKQQICNQYSPHSINPHNSKSPLDTTRQSVQQRTTPMNKSSLYFAHESPEQDDSKIRRVTVLTKPVSILKPVRKSNHSFEGTSPDKEDRVTTTQLSNKKDEKLEKTNEKKPLLISLLLNQTKESRLNKMMLKSSDSSTKLPTPTKLRYNGVQKGGQQQQTNENMNTTAIRRTINVTNVSKQLPADTFMSAQEVAQTTAVEDQEEAEYLEANIKKCNEWLDKHVIPYFSLSNNSTSNELLSSSFEDFSD